MSRWPEISFEGKLRIRRYTKAIKEGIAPDRRDQEYCLNALTAIAEGDAIERPKRGRPKNNVLPNRDLWLAVHVLEEHGNNEPLETAKEKVSIISGESYDTVEKAYKAKRKTAIDMLKHIETSRETKRQNMDEFSQGSEDVPVEDEKLKGK